MRPSSELAAAIGATAQGWMQIISDFKEPAEEMAMLRRVTGRAGRPMAITTLQRAA